jgi:hypothetical protein
MKTFIKKTLTCAGVAMIATGVYAADVSFSGMVGTQSVTATKIDTNKHATGDQEYNSTLGVGAEVGVTASKKLDNGVEVKGNVTIGSGDRYSQFVDQGLNNDDIQLREANVALKAGGITAEIGRSLAHSKTSADNWMFDPELALDSTAVKYKVDSFGVEAKHSVFKYRDSSTVGNDNVDMYALNGRYIMENGHVGLAYNQFDNAKDITTPASDEDKYKVLSVGGQYKHGSITLHGFVADNMVKDEHIKNTDTDATGAAGIGVKYDGGDWNVHLSSTAIDEAATPGGLIDEFCKFRSSYVGVVCTKLGGSYTYNKSGLNVALDMYFNDAIDDSAAHKAKLDKDFDTTAVLTTTYSF